MESCCTSQTKGGWGEIINYVMMTSLVMQTAHKKTFFYLEQLILKYHAHNHALRIKESHDGIDFFYAGKQEARKMVDFLQTVVPCRYTSSNFAKKYRLFTLEWDVDVGLNVQKLIIYL